MKRFATVVLAVMMILLFTAGVLAAIHASREEFFWGGDNASYFANVVNTAPTKDEWFSVKPSDPYFLGAIDYSDKTQLYGLYYFKNPQTFAEISDFCWGNDHSTYDLKGSYLFDFGLFAGVTASHDNWEDNTAVSLGYRFSWLKDSYLALSADYDTDDSELIGYDLDFWYYWKSGKLFGQVYVPKDDDTAIGVGADFRLSDSITFGLRGDQIDDENGYLAGLTWNSNKFVFNVKSGDDIVMDRYYALGFIYRFTEAFSVGGDYFKFDRDDDPVYDIKLKYKTKSFTFTLSYLWNNWGTP